VRKKYRTLLVFLSQIPFGDSKKRAVEMGIRREKKDRKEKKLSRKEILCHHLAGELLFVKRVV